MQITAATQVESLWQMSHVRVGVNLIMPTVEKETVRESERERVLFLFFFCRF